jgi:hypothetical protein
MWPDTPSFVKWDGLSSPSPARPDASQFALFVAGRRDGLERTSCESHDAERRATFTAPLQTESHL